MAIEKALYELPAGLGAIDSQEPDLEIEIQIPGSLKKSKTMKRYVKKGTLT